MVFSQVTWWRGDAAIVSRLLRRVYALVMVAAIGCFFLIPANSTLSGRRGR